MQNIKALRDNGYTVQPAVALGCTEVSSDKPFYFYNPRFASTPAEVYLYMKLATLNEGRHYIIVAGEYLSDSTNLPFVIIDQMLSEEVHRLHDEYVAMCQAAQAAEKKFADAMGKFIPK